VRRALAALAATAATVALLLGYKSSPGTAARPAALSAPATTVPSRRETAPPTSTLPAPAAPTPTTRTPSPTAPPPDGSGPSGTFAGPVVNTRYGPVQVEVTLVDGRLADVRAGELPVDRARSAAISNRAAPILRAEALAAQGARIDSVSGASVTSRAYAQSLQAALDVGRG
jgi:uncharacterized protein with FMN-binding domain